MRNILIASLFFLVFSETSFASNKENQTYCFDKTAPSLTWKAFKFTKKTAVPGTFNVIKYRVGEKAPDVKSLLKSIKFEIQTDSVNTANPARDATLKSHFFNKFSPSISGKVSSVENAQVTVIIKINNIEKPVVFSFAVDGNLNFKAVSSINLLDFALKDTHESIHSACLALHTGEDGISKTWSEVELELKGRFLSNCSK